MSHFNEKTIKKIKVVLRNGSQVDLPAWQTMYGLPINSSKIGKYFDYNEYTFMSDLTRYNSLIVNELLMRVIDEYRHEVKEVVNVNAFNRDQIKQDELREQGFSTAKISPHVFKLAADLDTISKPDTLEKAKIMIEVGKKLKIKIRVGYMKYLKKGQTFIHVDVCPEYYAPGKPWHLIPHPIEWEQELTW
jgi:hypothetical protein